MIHRPLLSVLSVPRREHLVFFCAPNWHRLASLTPVPRRGTPAPCLEKAPKQAEKNECRQLGVIRREAHRRRPVEKFELERIDNITITETPSDNAMSEGFGDGDGGDGGNCGGCAGSETPSSPLGEGPS